MKLGSATRIRDTACPVCGRIVEGASGLDTESLPKPGGVSVCISCGEISTFDENMALRRLTPKELLEVQLSPTWPQVQRLQNAVRTLHDAIARGERPAMKGGKE